MIPLLGLVSQENKTNFHIIADGSSSLVSCYYRYRGIIWSVEESLLPLLPGSQQSAGGFLKWIFKHTITIKTTRHRRLPSQEQGSSNKLETLWGQEGDQTGKKDMICEKLIQNTRRQQQCEITSRLRFLHSFQFYVSLTYFLGSHGISFWLAGLPDWCHTNRRLLLQLFSP